jgi:hypothetical protein
MAVTPSVTSSTVDGVVASDDASDVNTLLTKTPRSFWGLSVPVQ